MRATAGEISVRVRERPPREWLGSQEEEDAELTLKLPKMPAHGGLHSVGKPFAHTPPGSVEQHTVFICAGSGSRR